MRVFKPFLPITICLAAAVLVLSCENPTGSNSDGDDDDGNGGDGNVEEPQYAEGLSFPTSVEVSTYQEFAEALDDAEDEDAADWSEDEAFLINIVDDIDSGFAENGQLRYGGSIRIYVYGAAESRPTIDAKSESRILTVTGFGIASFEHLRFTNGYPSGGSGFYADSGGAIMADKSFTGSFMAIYNSVFESNQADGTGGALQISPQELEIVDSRFSENSAEGGGAVKIEPTNESSSIEGSVFENNESLTGVGYGGAIDVQTDSGVQISDSTFTGNSAGMSGGAVRTAQGGSIENSDFTNNTADQVGGAIDYGRGDTTSERTNSLEVSGSEFTGNEASSGVHTDVGGAIHGHDPETDGTTEIVISDSLFDGNVANPSGSDDGYGAVFTDGNNEAIRSSDTIYRDHTGQPVLGAADGDLIDDGGNEFEEGDQEPSWDSP